jgi:putative ABC transport system permease protein
LTVEGRPEPVATSAVRDVGQASITPNYLRVMGVPLERGRLFEDRDREVSEAVAIVNEALVRKYFPHESPIGKHIKVGEPETERPWLTIVGIAAIEKDKNFFREMTWEDIPLVFRPVSQDPPFTGSLVLRAAKDEMALGAAIQKQISALDSSVPVGEVQTMYERLSRVLAYPRFRAVVLGAFAALALLLAGVGLYGVLSQLTAQRTQEFGVRMALGAQKHDLLALVIRQGMLLTSAGLVAGVTVALCLTRFLSSLLYGVRATDPWTLMGGSLLLFLVACSATYIPERRAAKVDPMVALRYE